MFAVFFVNLRIVFGKPLGKSDFILGIGGTLNYSFRIVLCQSAGIQKLFESNLWNKICIDYGINTADGVFLTLYNNIFLYKIIG